MKSRFTVPAAVLLSAALAGVSAAQAPTPSPPLPLRIEKLAEGVWGAQPEKGANVGWFTLGDGVVVVDSGGDTATAQQILKAVADTAGKPVKTLILTHLHGDHSRGARVFAAVGATIMCQQNIAGSVLAYVTQPATEPGDPLAAKPGLRPIVESVGERAFLLDGLRTAEIDFLGAAHTSGDLIVYLVNEKILFAGDLATNGRLPDMKSPDADPRGWERALTNLSKVAVSKMVPGHGEVGPAAGLADSLAYVHRVDEIAQRFLDSGIRDDMIEAQIRAPENVIEHVPVTEAHVANVKAAMKAIREKAAKPPGTPAPAAKPAS